jgi:gamma-glutamyltranspeptidase/glutathione hydrolase
MGGEMQPQGHLQVVAAMVDRGMNPQAALDAPRWQVGTGRLVTVEPEVDEALVGALRARGHAVERAENRLRFGRGQIIARDERGVLVGGSEPRTDGAAIGL